MAGKRPPVKHKKSVMYLTERKELIYQERVAVYKEILEQIYPGRFRWDLHCVMLRILVRREMEYERCDLLIENDMDGWTIHDVTRRKEAYATMRGIYRDLGFTLPEMKKLQAQANEAGTFEDDMAGMIAKFQDRNG